VSSNINLFLICVTGAGRGTGSGKDARGRSSAGHKGAAKDDSCAESRVPGVLEQSECGGEFAQLACHGHRQSPGLSGDRGRAAEGEDARGREPVGDEVDQLEDHAIGH